MNLLFDHSRLSPMVNDNLFSKKHPFNWHRRRFIAVSPIEKRILKCMYICTYLCTYVHTMYVWFELLCLANTNTTKIKATATFCDICVQRNFESSEQYLSAKMSYIIAAHCTKNRKQWQSQRNCRSTSPHPNHRR